MTESAATYLSNVLLIEAQTDNNKRAEDFFKAMLHLRGMILAGEDNPELREIS